jgi:hypothetical protein
MANTVSPPPYSEPLLDANGFLNPAWAKWYRDTYTRIGGSIASTNKELAAAVDLTAINAAIASLNATTANHGTRLTDLENGNSLTKGRQL